jgi:hypothetical protein
MYDFKVDDVVEILEPENMNVVCGKNHYENIGCEATILNIDSSDYTAFANIEKKEWKLWLNMRHLKFVKNDRRCSCGGKAKEVLLLNHFMKVCSECDKEIK